jgi:hypothetical protein
MGREDVPLLPQKYLSQGQWPIFTGQRFFVGVFGLILALLGGSQQRVVTTA